MATYYISSGVISTGIILNNDSMYISSGGVANSTTVNSGGYMRISSGGTATAITENGGYVYVVEGATVTFTPNTISGLVLGSYASATLHSGTVANSTTVNSGGYMIISSGGVANSTTVSRYGSLTVLDDGVVNDTIVRSGGVIIFNNGNANDLTLKAGGRLGGFSFSEDKNWNSVSSGIVTISRNVTIAGKNMYISNGGSLDTAIVHSGSFMYIYSGSANNITISSGGYVYNNGGSVGNATLRGAYMFLNAASATASNTVLDHAGELHVSNGRATVNTINANGVLHVKSSGRVDSTVVNYMGYLHVSSGGSANGTTVNEKGFMFISSGGKATGTTVAAEGYLNIDRGGSAVSTTVHENSYLHIASGGIASDTIVADGELQIASGGMHRGSLQIESGAIVTVASGGVIEFAVEDRTAENSYLINNLARVEGAPEYTITLSANQEAGTYKLAQGAENFTGSVTVGDGAMTYGAVTVNGAALSANNYTYRLTQAGGNLLLDVQVVPLADLEVTLFAINNDMVSASESVSLNFTVQNTGSAGALASYADIYDGDVKLGRIVVSALKAGAVYNGSFAVAAGKLPIGEHNFRIELDTTNRVAESNEADNAGTAVLTVKARQADLTVSVFQTASDNITSGKSVTLNFTVQNTGSAGALASYADIYDGDVKLGRIVVSALKAGAVYNGSFAVAAGKLPIGEHNFRIELDTTNRVAESNELNNSAEMKVQITAAEAAVASWDVLGSGDFDGDNLTGEQLLLNEFNGQVAIQYGDDVLRIGFIDENCEFTGITDFNSDGFDDIAWSCAGETAIWQIKNDTLDSVRTIGVIA